MTPPKSGSKPVILCTVSDPSTWDAIRAALPEASFELVRRIETREAIAAARPDLALVACDAPGARERCAELVALGLRSIAIGAASECESALSAGAFDWITTPLVGPLLVHRVDAALRAARVERDLATARGRIEPAVASTPSPATVERTQLESELARALERGELALHYQPRVDIRTGAVLGFEALLRWKHARLGPISPAKFIPIAEESGLIVPIGEWALREACRQNQAWRTAGLAHVRIAVNLSSVQFRQPDLDARIARVLEETGLAPEGLELELTESMLLQDAESTIETLATFAHMGIGLAIDDFGTGYSSLSYIKRFPVDTLKIDQSFVREVLTSPADSAITTSIVLMGKSLGLTVVAEGVETRSQLEFLRVLECDEAQGYLFSRPVPAIEASGCLRVGYAALLGLGAPSGTPTSGR